MTQSNSDKGEELRLLDATNGVKQVIPTGSSIPIGGSPLTQPQLLAKLEGFEVVFQAVRNAQAVLHAALLAREAQSPAIAELLTQLKGALVAQLGSKNPELSKFGFKPSKAHAASGAKNVVKAAKPKITRQKRGTLGKKQKLGLKAVGTPTVVVGPTGIEVTAPVEATHPAPTSSATATAGQNGSGGTNGQ
ncbi:MAG: hypothetical protein ACYCWW_13090 [Deltaproteobacteria bacterium]